MVGVCKTCKVTTNVVVTRKRKLKDGTVVRDLHCNNCKYRLAAYHRRPIKEVSSIDTWNDRAWRIVHKLSKKYGNEYAKSK